MILHTPHSDRAVQEYRARSGAKNTYWLNEIVKYVKSEGLWDSFRLYPFMDRTNAGTGSTAYGLGGLTANEMTLVNGPTWGASGIAFASASSQYGTIADFLGSETLTVFARVSHASATPTAVESVLTQYGVILNERSWLLNYQGNQLGDPYWLARSTDGGAVNIEVYGTTDESNTTSDQCLVAQWIDGGGRSFWQNKTARTLALDFGSARTSRFNSTSPILLGAIDSALPANFANMTAHATAFLTGSVTTTQRETITDLINAL